MGARDGATVVPGLNPKPRLAILAAMPPHQGLKTAGIAAVAIAEAIGKTPSTIHQMLQALTADQLVENRLIEGKRLWFRTAKPTPQQFLGSTADAKEHLEDFTDIALREALGIPLAPEPHAPTRIIKGAR